MLHFYKRTLTLLLFLFLSQVLFAQNLGSIKGVVVDSVTIEPLSFSTIVLKKAESGVMVKGLQTLDDGAFNLTAIPFGNYDLQITFVGYKNYSTRVVLSKANPTIDMGVISVAEDDNMLEAVVVSAEGNTFTMQADKKVFDAEKIDAAAGGSAADVLRQIPLVELDADDNMQMRGKSVIVTVDGRPSPFPDVQTTIQMLPADAIERVEVITNPSARYMSEGAGGIVNIVLKKSMVRGYNGSVSLNITPNNQYRGGANFNYRVGKVNLFATANGRYMERRTESVTERQNFRADTAYEYVHQGSKYKNTSPGGVTKFGFDYFFDDKNSITVSEMISVYKNDSRDYVGLDYYRQPTMYKYRFGERVNEAHNTDYGYVTDINFKHIFNHKLEHEFTADFRYSYNDYDKNTDYRTQLERRIPISGGDSTYYEPLTQQLKDGGSGLHRLIARADYVQPIGTTGKFEAGVSVNNRWHNVKYDALTWENDQFVPNPKQEEDYHYVEQIYSGYADLANTFGKIGYKVGFRLEQSLMSGSTHADVDTSLKKNYFYVFPSGFLTYDLPEDQRLVASYSARISRPSFTALVPYVDISNIQNIRVGNSNLKPSYTHSVELSYSRFFKESKNSFNIDVYYQHTKDIIQRVSRLDSLTKYVPEAVNDMVNVSMSENVGKSQSLGTTAIFRYRKIKKLTITATVSASYDRMSGLLNGTEAYTTDKFVGNASLSATYTFPYKIVASTTGRWSSPRLTAQGSSQQYGTVDLSVRRSFFDKNLTVTIAVYDLFNTSKYVSHSQTSTFISDYERTSNSRQIRFSLMYKFGKLDTDVVNRRIKQSVELNPEDSQRSSRGAR